MKQGPAVFIAAILTLLLIAGVPAFAGTVNAGEQNNTLINVTIDHVQRERLAGTYVVVVDQALRNTSYNNANVNIKAGSAGKMKKMKAMGAGESSFCDEYGYCTLPDFVRYIVQPSLLPGGKTQVVVYQAVGSGRPHSVIDYIPYGMDVKFWWYSADVCKEYVDYDGRIIAIECLWLTDVEGGAFSYQLTVPDKEFKEAYNIYGYVGDEKGTRSIVFGEKSVYVGIEGYYSSLGYSSEIEDTDVVQAALDLKAKRVPPGFSKVITEDGLFNLSKKWAAGSW